MILCSNRFLSHSFSFKSLLIYITYIYIRNIFTSFRFQSPRRLAIIIHLFHILLPMYYYHINIINLTRFKMCTVHLLSSFFRPPHVLCECVCPCVRLFRRFLFLPTKYNFKKRIFFSTLFFKFF